MVKSPLQVHNLRPVKVVFGVRQKYHLKICGKINRALSQGCGHQGIIIESPQTPSYIVGQLRFKGLKLTGIYAGWWGQMY